MADDVIENFRWNEEAGSAEMLESQAFTQSGSSRNQDPFHSPRSRRLIAPESDSSRRNLMKADSHRELSASSFGGAERRKVRNW